MSDSIDAFEEAARRDRRFNDIRLGIDLEVALRKEGVMHNLLIALRKGADAAMADFAVANCGDLDLMKDLQSRVYRFRYTLEFFEEVLQRGRVAEREIKDEAEGSL